MKLKIKVLFIILLAIVLSTNLAFAAKNFTNYLAFFEWPRLFMALSNLFGAWLCLYGYHVTYDIPSKKKNVKNPKILYRCDHKQCEKCSYEITGCDLTNDVNHAINFTKDALGNYVEDEPSCLPEFVDFLKEKAVLEKLVENVDSFERVNHISAEDLKKALERAEKDDI